MQALRKTERRAGAIAVMEVERPSPGPGEVLLRVAACGVCGSDLHAYNEDPGYEWVKVPVTMGHEFAGTVEAVGPDVAGWSPGMRAAVVAIQSCGECSACRRGDTALCPERRGQGLSFDGGMAEWATVKTRFLVPLPEGLDLQAAALVEPLSVAVHCVSRRAEIAPGDLAVVTGPGIIGLLCALLARLRGAKVLVVGAPADRDARLPVAERLGFETLVAGDRPLSELLPRPADILIEASGSAAALSGALGAVRRGGSLTLVGLYAQPVTWFMTNAVRDELTIRCSYASTYPDYERAAQLLAAGLIPVDALISRYPLADGVTAFRDASEKKVMKPVLIP